MEIKSPMELATEALSYNNQNIASEAPKLLLLQFNRFRLRPGVK